MTTPSTRTTGTTVGMTDSAGSSGTVGTTPQRSFTRRVSTETKQAFKTTEFWIYALTVAGILIASMTVGNDNTAGKNGVDYFRADKAWLFITLASIGYLLSRGLAKAGSRDYYDDEVDNDPYGSRSKH